ncbi:hypothetical protein SAMN02745219_01546 [Desulfofundulus thermosubterraneus DSM 16057]|uniref:Uncharacterized protein n=1 Tax=Desulfofundulus thermosubterraneus DSM 16057 TaxID=1121432 RepID=A0A1M6FTQ2_9FIRM|nr:hypothetical protein SAMN02745219_01546 [Desulfofundulus thermosubterraneus DSM 16057]
MQSLILADVLLGMGFQTFLIFLSRSVILNEAVSDQEVRVRVDELADIELHGYTLRPVND